MGEKTPFGAWLRQRRRSLDITREGLAECVGCSLETVEKIEAGTRRPSKQVAELLADCLQIATDERAAFVRFAREEPGKQAPTVPIPAHTPEGAPTSALHPYLQQRQRRPNNIPAPLTPFIGREKEVEDALQRLLDDGVRLLTLTGPPGVGKTRLSLRVAEGSLDRFEHGVYFVELDAVRDPGLVAVTIARTLKVREAEGGTPQQSLKEYLRDRQMLLVLDNFEQVAEAAPMVAELLVAARHLKVLVSSRVLLHIYGEHNFPVSPMSLPDLKQLPSPELLTQYEAIRLFMARTSAAKPDFTLTEENAPLVAEICHRLEGLPLAIELAAARIRLLPPQTMLPQLADRLQLLTGGPLDLPARQQTLRTAIDWSYGLLTEPERALFGRLSVFAGGWEPEAAEVVCADPEVGEILAQLVDKSLVIAEEHQGRPRYRMLETIREYARTKLDDMAAYDRMAEFFAGYVEDHSTDYNALDLETPNVLAALQAASDRGLPAALVRGANAFYHFLETRGLYGLARLELKRAEQAGRSAGDILGLVTVLLNLGRLEERHGDYGQAEAHYTEGLALAQEVGHRERTSALLQNLGGVVIRRGDYARAEAHLLEGLALAREVEDPERISALLGNLGTVAFNRGDYTQAEAYYQESLALARTAGNRERICALLQGLGAVMTNRGDYERADAYFKEGLALAREIGHRERTSFLLMNLGSVTNTRGDGPQAEAYYLEGLDLAREIDNPERISDLLRKLGELSCSHGDYELAEAYLLEGLALARALNHRERISGLLCASGTVARLREDYAQAEVYFDEGLDLARSIGHQRLVGNILDECGELYLKQRQEGAASEVFGEALAIAREVGSHDLAATALYGLARAALSQNDLDSARRRGIESLEIFESIGHTKVAEVRQWLNGW